MKKQIVTVVTSCALSIAIMFLAVPAWTVESSVAYVVNQEVFEGFTGMKEMQEELEQVQVKHQKYMDSLYIKVEGEGTSTAQDFKTKSEQFMLQEQELSARYTQQVWGQINSYLADFAKEHDYKMVLGADGSGSLMYADETDNVTEQVIQYINDKYEGKVL